MFLTASEWPSASVQVGRAQNENMEKKKRRSKEMMQTKTVKSILQSADEVHTPQSYFALFRVQ